MASQTLNSNLTSHNKAFLYNTPSLTCLAPCLGTSCCLFSAHCTGLQVLYSTQGIHDRPYSSSYSHHNCSTCCSTPEIVTSTPLHISSISSAPLYAMTLPHTTTQGVRSDMTVFIQTSRTASVTTRVRPKAPVTTYPTVLPSDQHPVLISLKTPQASFRLNQMVNLDPQTGRPVSKHQKN